MSRPATVRERQAEILNRFPEVRWDRTAGPDDDSFRVVFGWVPGPRDRADFVAVEFVGDDFGLFTSSRRYSEEFSRRLFGDTAEHHPCQNVADVFGDLIPNKITHRRPAPLDPSILGQ